MQLNSKQNQSNKHHVLQQQTKMFTEPLQFQKRKCTDVFCIYVAVLFFSICIVLSFALRNSENEIKLSYVSDSDGKVCGIDYPEYPSIYFTNLPQIGQRICVASCPRVEDKKLSCMPTSSIGCSFSQTVRFTETTLQSYQNSNICMPVNSKVSNSLIRARQILSRISLSNPLILLTTQFAFGLGLIIFMLVNYFPKMTIETVQYLSLIFEILLAIILYAYETEGEVVKYFTMFLLSCVFIITLSQILLLRHELKLNRVFIIQSCKFMQLNKGLTSYIIIFQVLLFCFLQFLFTMYNNILSAAKLSFKPETSLYYTPKSVNNSMILILVIFAVWVISFIQQLYKFFITAHTINWYLKLPNNFATIKYTFLLLLHKHIGTVIASAFINGFFFVPKMIYDLIFVPTNNNQHCTHSYCSSILDLARADTLSFVILAGLPFCNSSRYCDYFWSQTMISQKNQSSIRIYKITGHMLIAIICSMIGLLTRDQVDICLLLSTLIIGLLIGTFFIDFNAICAQTLQLLYIMEQQFSKRPQGKAKVVMNLLNRADQVHFVNRASQLFKNEEVALQITSIKKIIWKIDTNPIVNKQQVKEQQYQNCHQNIQKELITQQQQT